MRLNGFLGLSLNERMHYDADLRCEYCRRPSLRITRTPDKQFEDVYEPFRQNYLHVTDPVHGGNFRVHYLDEGDPDAKEVRVLTLDSIQLKDDDQVA